jgi:hypothetical protein
LIDENAPANEQDILNTAALRTLEHRGEVFALKASEMPDKADAIAVLRY